MEGQRQPGLEHRAVPGHAATDKVVTLSVSVTQKEADIPLKATLCNDERKINPFSLFEMRN